MLENIHVKNIALIKEIDISFGSGLNIITGETGAGKSLIIGSVNIGLGAKVPKDYIFLGEEEALVELTFSQISKEVREILSDNDIPIEDDTVVIQRRITKTRTVNRINYTTVSLAILKMIGTKLMQIHGQHDNQILLNKSSHIDILDAFAGEELKSIKDQYKNKFSELLDVHSEIKNLLSKKETRDRDIDYMSFVVDEIEKVNPQIGEDEKLREKYNNMVDLQNSYDGSLEAYNCITNIVQNEIGNAKLNFNKIKDLDIDATQIFEDLLNIEELIKDVKKSIESYIEKIDFNEEEFNLIDNRIDKLDSLKNKYGGSIKSIIDLKSNYLENLDVLRSFDEKLLELKKKRTLIGKDVDRLAQQMSETRKRYALLMEEKIITLLEELNFIQVKFKFNIINTGKLHSNGYDDVQMYISTNVGHDLKPLASVSSGGELSRIMLAIESIISNIYSVSGIIFDEVDTGISGKTGVMVAKRLKDMSKSIQIICITHLPQLAAAGDIHYKIEKEVVNNTTITKLQKLDKEQSVLEIARLLGGIDITEATLQNARELLAH